MVKKLTTLILGLATAFCALAQSGAKSVTINQSDIQYWTGTGTNSTVVAIGWDDATASYTPTVVVWGIHWSGTITLLDALDTLAAYDSRFSYTISGSFLSGVSYLDSANAVYLTPSAGWNCNNYNGTYGYTNLSTTWLRISESTCSDYNFSGVNNLIYASDPNATNTLPDTVDASLPFCDILYWVGSGTDSAEFIINFADPDTALAWGYLFNGSTSAQNMINAIAAADPRFWVVGTPSYNGDLHFITDNGDTLGLSAVNPSMGYNFWWSNLNGVSAGSGTAETLHNGDVFKFGDLNSATGWDAMGTYFMEEAWNTIPTPVPVPGSNPATPDDASFSASDILYWVGEGSNEVVMAINWADTALAWGYRFNGSKSVSDMMADIAAADPRFSYSLNGTFISDINFIAGGTTLGITAGNYWWSLLNHEAGMGMSDNLADGDFYKWGDLSVAVVTDSTWIADWNYWDYTYVWPYTIHPVSQPVVAGPFCGAAGTEGSSAIAFDDSRIKAWATGCTLVLGSQDLSNPNAPVVSYGTADDAIGPATASTLDVVSLGDGGSATLTFENPIVDGDGYDFAVFENSFNDYFLELAFVEVSSDGQHFVRFPATSLTQTTVQVTNSVDPTNINNLAGKYRAGFGTPFDLNELRDSAGIDISNITHVRIVDVVGSIDPQYGTYDAFGHIINDPFPTVSYSSGFDLDGVAVLNQKTETIEVADSEIALSVAPNPASDRICIRMANLDNSEAALFDMNGRLVKTLTLREGDNNVDISALPNGLYIVRVAGRNLKVVKK